MNNKNYGFATNAIHAGQEPDKTTGAIMIPISMSSTFIQTSPGVPIGYEYARCGNPTRQAFEDCVATLENGNWGLAFASGSAATASIAHLLNQGDEVLVMHDVYGGHGSLLSSFIQRYQM